MNAMPGITGTGFSGRPPVSSDTAERRASPFRSRGARSASTERADSAEAEAYLSQCKIIEEVVSPLMAKLTERMGTVETRVDTIESAMKQENDGLKARITQLEGQDTANKTHIGILERQVENIIRDLKVVADVAADHRHHVSGFNKYGYDCTHSLHPKREICRKI